MHRIDHGYSRESFSPDFAAVTRPRHALLGLMQESPVDREGEQDAVLSLFDPAFTFENLLANGDPTLQQSAAPSKGFGSSSSIEDATVPLSQDFLLGTQSVAGSPDLHASSQLGYDYPDHSLAGGYDLSKQRARATQARFRQREKVSTQSAVRAVQCTGVLPVSIVRPLAQWCHASAIIVTFWTCVDRSAGAMLKSN